MIDTEEPRIDDISLGGCFVNTRAHVEINETVHLEVRFPSGEWLPLPGRVISYQPGVGFGLSFTPLSDREIFTLKQLT